MINYHELVHQVIFWGVWLLIPLMWEIVIGCYSAIIVSVSYKKNKKKHVIPTEYFPMVTVVVPVYNSEKTLEQCLNSIYRQTYPIGKLEVMLVDNGSRDDSYAVFDRFQRSHTDMNVRWLTSPKGKSQALNKGIFASTGKYIINIDSDGWIDQNAIVNVITRFEEDAGITCMTGVVLIDCELIEETHHSFLKLVRKCELYEYAESFLVARHFQSLSNQLFTIAGAFSCFRKDSLFRTQMYNFETIGEDTHMTFQIRRFVGGKIILCPDAFMYVDPIDSIDKLYVQRQRWQRGEMEVANLFSNLRLGRFVHFLRTSNMRLIVSDHTLAFPKLIWMFAIIYLYFINYPLKLIAGSMIILYLFYVANSFIYLYTSLKFMDSQQEMKKYMKGSWYVIFVLPLYRFTTYWIRFAGIINSLTTQSKWQTRSLSEEIAAVKYFFTNENSIFFKIWTFVDRCINNRNSGDGE